MKRFIAIAVGAALCGPAGALAYEETTETRLSVEVKPGAPARAPSVEERTHESTTVVEDDGDVKKEQRTYEERTVRQQAAPPPPPPMVEKRTPEVERTED